MAKQITKKGFCAYYLGGLFVRMNTNNILLLCAGLAFSTLLCLVPLVFLLFFVFEVILDVGAIAHLINRTVDVLIPYTEEAGYLKEVLSTRVSGVMTFKEAYGVSGLLILIVSASSLFSSMRTLLNAVFKVEHSSGPKEGDIDQVTVERVKNMDTPGRWVKFLYGVFANSSGQTEGSHYGTPGSVYFSSISPLTAHPICRHRHRSVSDTRLCDLLLRSHLLRPDFCRVSGAILVGSTPEDPDKDAGHRCFLGCFAVENYRMDFRLLSESLHIYIVSVWGLCSAGSRGLVDILLGNHFYYRRSDRPTLPRKADC